MYENKQRRQPEDGRLMIPVVLDDYVEVDTKPNGNFCNYEGCKFDWDFTGGVFPDLTH